MSQAIIHVALVVRDYDEAITFYTEKLGFELIEDTAQPEQEKRWVVVAPPGGHGTTLLLARAATPEQARFVGDQAGGRVFLFLRTDDFWRDYHTFRARGVRFSGWPLRSARRGHRRHAEAVRLHLMLSDISDTAAGSTRAA